MTGKFVDAAGDPHLISPITVYAACKTPLTAEARGSTAFPVVRLSHIFPCIGATDKNGSEEGVEGVVSKHANIMFTVYIYLFHVACVRHLFCRRSIATFLVEGFLFGGGDLCILACSK